MYIKHKRLITAMALIFVAMLFVSADKKMSSTREWMYGNYNFEMYSPVIAEFIKDEVTFVSMRLGTDYTGAYYYERYNDELEDLFDKFDVPYEYRDYTRQICSLQNVNPLVFVSLVQIESHWGNAVNGVASHYNDAFPYRMYGLNKQWADLGLTQLSTRYAEEQENRYFNPELIRSLGYIRENFDQRDPWINLQTGCAYLGFLYRYFGSYELALQSYNTGIGNVIKGIVPDITYEYTHAIMNNWKYRERDV